MLALAAQLTRRAQGGPVPGGVVLHGCPDVDGTLLLGDGAEGGGEGSVEGGVEKPPSHKGSGGGVYLGGDLARLAALLGTKAVRRRDVRFFAGEAVWSSGQLEAELARGEWLLASAAPDWVFGPAAHTPGQCMWQRAMRSMGGEHAAMAALPPRVAAQEAPGFAPLAVRVHVL